jgi:dipeptidyl aminopeptidase/acylaminoacyl peptidase
MTKCKITAEDLYRIHFVNDPQVSPDGERVVFVQTIMDEKKKYRSHLFIQQIKSKEVIQWTNGETKDTQPRWSPDGKQIAFLSNRTGKNQIWHISSAGGEATRLTHCKNGVNTFSWSPEGKTILFSTPLSSQDSLTEQEESEGKQDVKEPYVVNHLRYKSDGLGLLDGKHSQLVLINLKTKKLRQLTDGEYDHSDGAWSPDGSKIALVANRSGNEFETFKSDLYVISLQNGEWKQLTNGTGSFSSPVWSPDGTKLSCLGHELEYDGATLERVWVFDVESGEMTCITGQWDVHAGDAAIGDMRSGHSSSGAIWSVVGKGLYFLASENGNTNLYYTDLNGSIQQLGAATNRHVFSFSLDSKQEFALLGVSDPQNPGDLYCLSLIDGTEQRLTAVNEWLHEIELSAPEPLEFSVQDGWKIHGWILKPVGFQEGVKYPMVLEVHGGPHAMYANTFFHELQLLAAQGYVILYTNPRGSHGYGQAFVDACRGDYGGKDYTDLMSAVDHVLEYYDFIDDMRLGVTGGSYGGFMTNWIVGHTDRFKAAVTQRSISNWISFYGVSDIGYFFSEWEIGGNGFETQDKLWAHSPIRFVFNVATPLLILHGERDYRCPIEQAEQFYVALKHQNKAPVEFVRFPDSNHELSRSGEPTLRVERLNRIIGWFAKYL